VDIPTPTITSLSPATAVIGRDVAVTITGTNFATPRTPDSPARYYSTFVVIHAEPNDLQLLTRVASETQLTVVIDASLLTASTATIFVVNGDGMGWADGVSYPESNRVTLDVTRAP